MSDTTRPPTGRWINAVMEQRQAATRKATEAKVAAARKEGWT